MWSDALSRRARSENIDFGRHRMNIGRYSILNQHHNRRPYATSSGDDSTTKSGTSTPSETGRARSFVEISSDDEGKSPSIKRPKMANGGNGVLPHATATERLDLSPGSPRRMSIKPFPERATNATKSTTSTDENAPKPQPIKFPPSIRSITPRPHHFSNQLLQTDGHLQSRGKTLRVERLTASPSIRSQQAEMPTVILDGSDDEHDTSPLKAKVPRPLSNNAASKWPGSSTGSKLASSRIRQTPASRMPFAMDDSSDGEDMVMLDTMPLPEMPTDRAKVSSFSATQPVASSKETGKVNQHLVETEAPPAIYTSSREEKSTQEAPLVSETPIKAHPKPTVIHAGEECKIQSRQSPASSTVTTQPKFSRSTNSSVAPSSPLFVSETLDVSKPHAINTVQNSLAHAQEQSRVLLTAGTQALSPDKNASVPPRISSVKPTQVTPLGPVLSQPISIFEAQRRRRLADEQQDKDARERIRQWRDEEDQKHREKQKRLAQEEEAATVAAQKAQAERDHGSQQEKALSKLIAAASSSPEASRSCVEAIPTISKEFTASAQQFGSESKQAPAPAAEEAPTSPKKNTASDQLPGSVSRQAATHAIEDAAPIPEKADAPKQLFASGSKQAPAEAIEHARIERERRIEAKKARNEHHRRAEQERKRTEPDLRDRQLQQQSQQSRHSLDHEHTFARATVRDGPAVGTQSLLFKQASPPRSPGADSFASSPGPQPFSLNSQAGQAALARQLDQPARNRAPAKKLTPCRLSEISTEEYQLLRWKAQGLTNTQMVQEFPNKFGCRRSQRYVRDHCTRAADAIENARGSTELNDLVRRGTLDAYWLNHQNGPPGTIHRGKPQKSTTLGPEAEPKTSNLQPASAGSQAESAEAEVTQEQSVRPQYGGKTLTWGLLTQLMSDRCEALAEPDSESEASDVSSEGDYCQYNYQPMRRYITNEETEGGELLEERAWGPCGNPVDNRKKANEAAAKLAVVYPRGWIFDPDNLPQVAWVSSEGLSCFTTIVHDQGIIETAVRRWSEPFPTPHHLRDGLWLVPRTGWIIKLRRSTLKESDDPLFEESQDFQLESERDFDDTTFTCLEQANERAIAAFVDLTFKIKEAKLEIREYFKQKKREELLQALYGRGEDAMFQGSGNADSKTLVEIEVKTSKIVGPRNL